MKTDLTKLKDRNLYDFDFFKKWNQDYLLKSIEKLNIDLDTTPTHVIIKKLSAYVRELNNGKAPAAISLNYYILRGHSMEYAKEVTDKLKKTLGQNAAKTKKLNPEKYDYTGGPISKKYWIKKGFTEEEAKIKQKENSPNSKYFYIKQGYSEEESIKLVAIHQSKQSLKAIKKRKENPQKYMNYNANQLLYWIDKGFSEEQAKQKLKERQSTFTLEKCISKYGKEEGFKIFQERQIKWKEKINKSFEENGDGRSPQSKFAKDIIQTICNELGIEVPKKEKWMSSKSLNLKCSYDFTYNNKIIEFNGDYWHANPKYNKPNDIIRGLNITAQDKWNHDKQKIELANKRGYEVLVIWESDYNENKENVIKNCLNFLK